MPLVTYAFEVGPDGAAATQANAGVSIVTAPNGGTAVYDSAQQETGVYSVRLTNAASNQALMRTLAAAGSTSMSFSFAFRTPTSAPPTGHTLLVQTLRHSSGAAARFHLHPDMSLTVTDTPQTGSLTVRTGLAVGTWYRVSGWVIVGGTGTNISLNIYPKASNTPLNGSPVTATAWNLGSAAIVGGDSGVASSPPVSMTTWIDNLQWSNGVTTHLPYLSLNAAPTVSAGADQTVTAGATVNLTATALDQDGTIASYQWSVLSSPGAAPTITGAATANASFVADSQGAYVLRVTVTDNLGATATDDVTVSVPAPGARPVSLTGSTSWANVGGAASIPAALADESATTYAQSPSSGSTTVTTRLEPLSPSATLELDVSGYTAGSGAGVATVELVEGSTVRASWPWAPTGSNALATLVASTAQVQAITNWGALDVRFRWAADRDSLVYGAYEPSTDTAGVPAGTTLTTVTSSASLPTSTGSVSPTATGLWRITTPNTVIENKDIFGSIDIRTTGVIVRYCKVRGRPSSVLVSGATNPLIACDNSANNGAPARIHDCTIVADTSMSGVDGFRGSNFYADRNIIGNVVDGFHLWTRDTTVTRDVWIRGNLGTGLAWHTETRPEGTHNDWVQFQGGVRPMYVTIVGNSFNSGFTPYGSSNLGLIVTDNEGIPGGWAFDNNWFYTKLSGTPVAIPVNITINTVTNFTMRGNKIQMGRDGYHIIARSAIRSLVQSQPGNVDLDTGAAIIVANGG